MAATQVAAPADKSAHGRTFSLTPGGGLRVVLAVAIVGFLLIYVGPTTIGATLLKAGTAVGITVVLFVGANKLFDLAYTRWTDFCAAAGFIVGFVVFLVLDGNRALRDIGWTGWLWAIIGGAATGTVLLARQRDARWAGEAPESP